MKLKLATLLFTLLASSTFASATVTNCQQGNADWAQSVATQLTLNEPDTSSVLVWATAMGTYLAEGDSQLTDDAAAHWRQPDVVSPANGLGIGALYIYEPGEYDGSPIMVQWAAVSETLSLIVCELPNVTGQPIAGPVLSRQDYATSVTSGKLAQRQYPGRQPHLYVFCVEAGASIMEDWQAGAGFYIPANASTLRGACQFGDLRWADQTSVEWSDESLHISTVYLEF